MSRKLFLYCKLLLYSTVFYSGDISASAAAYGKVSCEYCCPHLFSNSRGIITVRENSSLLYSISYLIRCSMSAEEVVIVSDSNSPLPAHQRAHWTDEIERKRRVCTRTENVLLSYITATDFLESIPGYFQKIVATSHPGRVKSVSEMMTKRTNFIFIPNSQEQMRYLINKVEQELQKLRTDRNSFWQPYIIFLWPEIQHVSGYAENDESSSYHSPGESLLHSWLESLQPYFSLDSGIFYIFIVQNGNSARSQTNLRLSIWESYKLKGKFIVQEITELSDPGFTSLQKHERCDAILATKTTLTWTEKVNSYLFLERFSRRDNFRRLPVTASTTVKEFTEATDWVTVRRKENGTVELASGASVNIYKDLQQMLNFSEQVLLGDRVQYINDRNDSIPTTPPKFSDMADILLDQKSVTPMRGEIYTFLQPTYVGIYGAFFRQPNANAIRNIVSEPFTAGLWTVFVGTWLLITGCLSCWGYIAKRNYVFTENDNDSIFIQEVVLWAVSAITQKSWYISPSSSNFKTIFFIGSTMALICYVAYSAVIVSFLTVKVIPIQSLSDLITYNYKFTVHESSEVTISLLEEMIIQHNLSQTVLKINTENEITHLNQRTRALISYPDLFYRTANDQNFTEKFICTSIDNLPATNYKTAMSVRKASQFRESLSSKLLIIMERGLNNRYRRTFEDNKAVNCPKKGYNHDGKSTIDPVRLTDVFTTFLVIFIGWFAAVWMFFTERLYRRRKTMYDFMFIVY